MSLNKYQDKWSRYHDKIAEGRVVSNNGWIYTAYAKSIGLTARIKDLKRCFDLCEVSRGDSFVIDRSPYDPTPPISKDEITGLISLGLLSAEDLIANDWVMFSPSYVGTYSWKAKLDAIIILMLVQFRLEGSARRNYAWENNLYAIYDMVFKYPSADQYYAVKLYQIRRGIKVKGNNIFTYARYYVKALYNAKFGNNSVKNYLWLQLKDLRMTKSLPYRILTPGDTLTEYFGKDHVITKRWKRNE